MTQTTFPEIQAATGALQSRIAITESEMAEMKQSIAETATRSLAPKGPRGLQSKTNRSKEACSTKTTNGTVAGVFSRTDAVAHQETPARSDTADRRFLWAEPGTLIFDSLTSIPAR